LFYVDICMGGIHAWIRAGWDFFRKPLHAGLICYPSTIGINSEMPLAYLLSYKSTTLYCKLQNVCDSRVLVVLQIWCWFTKNLCPQKRASHLPDCKMICKMKNWLEMSQWTDIEAILNLLNKCVFCPVIRPIKILRLWRSKLITL
jgi:hypothetical protein